MAPTRGLGLEVGRGGSVAGGEGEECGGDGEGSLGGGAGFLPPMIPIFAVGFLGDMGAGRVAVDSGSDSVSDSVSAAVTVSGEGFIGAFDGGSGGGGGDGDFRFVAGGRCLLLLPPKEPSFVCCGFEVVSAILVCAGGGLEELDWWNARGRPKGPVGESASSAGTAG